MNDETRKFIEESYINMKKSFIALNEEVKNGKMTAESFIQKRKEMIQEYQVKRKELESDEV
jgi:hypothetical protein|tara:strand:- start:309 stop:491 length:183 start_codon:yes stop_codon:yes gene_type:complete